MMHIYVGMDGLKPCPFCGSAADLVKYTEGDKICFVARCSHCGCGPFVKNHSFNKNELMQQAIDAWNVRSQDNNDDSEKLTKQCIECGAPTKYAFSICKDCADRAGRVRDEYIASLKQYNTK